MDFPKLLKQSCLQLKRTTLQVHVEIEHCESDADGQKSTRSSLKNKVRNYVTWFSKANWKRKMEANSIHSLTSLLVCKLRNKKKTKTKNNHHQNPQINKPQPHRFGKYIILSLKEIEYTREHVKQHCISMQGCPWDTYSKLQINWRRSSLQR